MLFRLRLSVAVAAISLISSCMNLNSKSDVLTEAPTKEAPNDTKIKAIHGQFMSPMSAWTKTVSSRPRGLKTDVLLALYPESNSAAISLENPMKHKTLRLHPNAIGCDGTCQRFVGADKEWKIEATVSGLGSEKPQFELKVKYQKEDLQSSYSGKLHNVRTETQAEESAWRFMMSVSVLEDSSYALVKNADCIEWIIEEGFGSVSSRDPGVSYPAKVKQNIDPFICEKQIKKMDHIAKTSIYFDDGDLVSDGFDGLSSSGSSGSLGSSGSGGSLSSDGSGGLFSEPGGGLSSDGSDGALYSEPGGGVEPIDSEEGLYSAPGNGIESP